MLQLSFLSMDNLFHCQVGIVGTRHVYNAAITVSLIGLAQLFHAMYCKCNGRLQCWITVSSNHTLSVPDIVRAMGIYSIAAFIVPFNGHALSVPDRSCKIQGR